MLGLFRPTRHHLSRFHIDAARLASTQDPYFYRETVNYTECRTLNVCTLRSGHGLTPCPADPLPLSHIVCHPPPFQPHPLSHNDSFLFQIRQMREFLLLVIFLISKPHNSIKPFKGVTGLPLKHTTLAQGTSFVLRSNCIAGTSYSVYFKAFYILKIPRIYTFRRALYVPRPGGMAQLDQCRPPANF